MFSLDLEPLKENAQTVKTTASEAVASIVPVAHDKLAIVPNTVNSISDRIAERTHSAKRTATIATVVGAAACVGACAAVIGHLVFHGKALKAYSQVRDEKKAAREWENMLDDIFADCVCACPSDDFELLYSRGSDEDMTGLLDVTMQPGCYAIMRFDDKDDFEDLCSYRDVYVGAGKNMAESVHAQLSGRGNLYVHADVVYGQPLQVLFFPCEAYQIYDYRESLIEDLGAEDSYNKISDVERIS